MRFRFENAYISMRLGFPFSSKMNRFENALESGSKRKRIKMKTMTENIAGAYAWGVRIEFKVRHNVQF